MPAPIRIFALFLLAPLPAWPQAEHDPLTRVDAVRALGFAEAAAGQPVALHGVVTYLRDLGGRVFNFNLNDGTGGVMVYPHAALSLQPGQQVSLTGTTTMSVHGLRIDPATVTPGPMATLPEPERISMAELSAGTWEGRYVEIEGIVRVVRLESIEISPQRLALDFGPRHRRVTALITHFQGAEERFVPGAALRLRGVLVRWTNARGQTQSVILMMNRAEDAISLGPPIAPTPQSAADVQFWTGPEEPAQRLATGGIVTFSRPDDFLVIQESGRAIRVRPTAFPQGLMPGTQVEVSGFPVLGEYTVELEDAVVSPVGSAPLPAAESYPDAAAVLVRQGLVDRDARLISVPATLREIREGEGLRTLELTSGKNTFTAWLPREAVLPDALVPGAALHLTGICTLHLTAAQRRTGQPPGSFSLHLSGPEQIQILHAGPWWNQTRLRRALGGIAVLALTAALWATLTSRKNARLRTEIARRERAEQQLATDRRRVAGDLHDTLEQTLVAARLQLNAASRTLESQPEAAAARLALAHQLVARGRQEVRDAVWDLHAGTGSAGAPAQVLAAACQEATAGADSVITFTSEGETPPLPALVMTQAVRFVREAVTNALKHARPRHIKVHLATTPVHLTLTISDDGSGFDPAAAPGPETGHFGLSSMQERLQRAGGTLTVRSQPGAGSILTAHLPLSPP